MADILIISDGKPGHFNQSAGLADALIRLHPHLRVDTQPPIDMFGVISLFIRSFFCRSLAHQKKPLVIIAAGHRTHWALLALGRFFNAKTVVLMKPSLPMRWFGLCILPEHDVQAGKTYPTNMISTKGALNRVVAGKKTEGTKLILIGGPAKHFQWDNDKVLDQLSSLFRKSPQAKWVVATSRRTPSSFVSAFQQLGFPASLVLAESTNRDWLPEVLAKTETCWVTEDSVSMIYEALTAGCQVGVINLKPLTNSRVVGGLSRLKQEGLIASSVNDEPKTGALSFAEADRSAEIISGYGWL